MNNMNKESKLNLNEFEIFKNNNTIVVYKKKIKSLIKIILKLVLVISIIAGSVFMMFANKAHIMIYLVLSLPSLYYCKLIYDEYKLLKEFSVIEIKTSDNLCIVDSKNTIIFEQIFVEISEKTDVTETGGIPYKLFEIKLKLVINNIDKVYHLGKTTKSDKIDKLKRFTSENYLNCESI